MAGYRKRLRLGDALVQAGFLTEEKLNEALEKQKGSGKLLGELLVELGYVHQEDIMQTLSSQMGIKTVRLLSADIDEKAVKLITEPVARKYKLIPYRFSKSRANGLKVAMADPLDIGVIDDVSIITGMQVEPEFANVSEINSVIDRFFGKQQAVYIAEQFKKEQEDYIVDEEEDTVRNEDVENSPIVQLVKNMIEQAVRQRASDIHIEPFETFIRVRYRIDGVLQEIINYDIALLSAIIARIKIISGMDISEKRKPQDGRITIEVDYKEYDLRVSDLPTVWGEKVVMRIASKEGFKRDKKDLGLRDDDLKKFDEILKNPNGIILVTGPTGSGKSTTLYTALAELAKPDVNVITVEDPVEANVDGVNQVQVNNKADMTFANALRSILRQDPDIIMIGEIRDSETADIAVKASITGHLVVSTLHTNSTAATVGRLVDMGVEPYLLGDSLVGIIAQRLVRRLCTCKKKKLATDEDKRLLGYRSPNDLYIYEPCGCKECNGTGYKGRVGIYEIMTVNQKIKNLIARRATADELKRASMEDGMKTLRYSAALKVCEGITSIDEMMKVTFNVDDI